jgi:hypothetical protein
VRTAQKQRMPHVENGTRIRDPQCILGCPTGRDARDLKLRAGHLGEVATEDGNDVKIDVRRGADLRDAGRRCSIDKDTDVLG